jgi:hypothetical protein
LTRVATAVSEPELLTTALHAPASYVERLVRGLRTAQRGAVGSRGKPGLKPEDRAGDEVLKPLPAQRDAWRVGWHWDVDGDLVISGRLSAEDGARLLAAVTRAQNVSDTEPDIDSEPDIDTKSAAAGERDGGPAVGRDADADADADAGDVEALADPEMDAGANDGADAGGGQVSASWMRAPVDLSAGLVRMAEMVSAGLAAPVFAPAAEVQVSVDIDTVARVFAAADHPSPKPGAESGPESAPGSTPGSAAGSAQPEVGSAESGDGVGEGLEDQALQLGKGARIEDGPGLSDEALRRLMGGARISLAVLAGDGRTLEVARGRRAPSAAQLRVLWRRDRGCSVPGCERTRFLHAHHVVWWSRGGVTELNNLVLLCGEHHRRLHAGEFGIQALGRQRFEFTTFRGTRIEPAPAMHGSADDLRRSFGQVDPEAIIPAWDGSPLHRWAIAAYFDRWRTHGPRPQNEAA